MTETINPGVRNTVAWLNDHGFETTDSGDGETHDFDCDRPVPYVVIVVKEKDKLATETDMLVEWLRDRGVPCAEIGEDGIPPEGHVSIQASYDPANGLCFIDVMGLCDRLMFKEAAS